MEPVLSPFIIAGQRAIFSIIFSVMDFRRKTSPWMDRRPPGTTHVLKRCVVPAYLRPAWRRRAPTISSNAYL
ncbi:hypothetical protein Btus_3188 [Kyrpidia tusciae DSM 2912]|uniref:Uncharacterized protein n=1 Tax=Kyrpidia tusciae (strain DSM 2912 / NBRC 15312 / T2) TaxID=562970 RepID=D5WX18_KYRT2|nr:hypothetical protein Btus_3188 [Kyrpidia tusciae DSM 2912]